MAEPTCFGPLGTSGFASINTGSGWRPGPDINTFPIYAFARDTVFEDVNRDGLADMVPRKISQTNGTYRVALNTGVTEGSPWRFDIIQSDPGVDARPGTRVSGDIDGDGTFDSVVYRGPLVYGDNPETPEVEPCSATVFPPKVALGTGLAYDLDSAWSYLAAVNQYTPPASQVDCVSGAFDYFAMADLNADGLAEFIGSRINGGEVLVNTGATWRNINGLPRWQSSRRERHSNADS